MEVTPQQLAYFVALADVRSFTRAADLVGVAQPTQKPFITVNTAA